MVRDVFDETSVGGLKGWMGVGHGKYPILFGRRQQLKWQCGIQPPVARHIRKLSLSMSTHHTGSSLHMSAKFLNTTAYDMKC